MAHQSEMAKMAHESEMAKYWLICGTILILAALVLAALVYHNIAIRRSKVSIPYNLTG